MPDYSSTANTLELLVASTEYLNRDVAGVDLATVTQPSALPGWSRAHVLTHLARNADGLRNLLLAARTGVALRMYANPRARTADIDAGASRPAEVIVDDVLESDRRFLAEAAAMPADAWEAEVAFTSGQRDAPSIPAATVILMRLNEVAIHHVDLAVGVEFSDISASVSEMLIHRYERRYATQGIAVDHIEGTSADRLAWLAGRGEGLALRAPGGAPLPTLPNLG